MEPIVETNYGKVRGFNLPLENGLSTNIFLRIPFAQPPIGELRLEKPQPPKPWDDVHESTYFSPSCVQHSRFSPILDTSEDSLYLDVIGPPKRDGIKYLVLFFIHASGWAVGSGVQMGYKGIAERWTPQEIIVITFNYRLGALGFMSTGDETLPGNLGLWDQYMALKFVHENIHHFGGDPEKITVWGASAGAISASILGISPYTKDLFQQLIQMSGSVFSEWGASDRVIEESKKLAKELGCTSDNSLDIKKFMKLKSIDEIQNAIEKLGTSRHDLNNMLYHPRIDTDFLPDLPENLLKIASKKPTMMGISTQEGAIFTIQLAPGPSVLGGLKIHLEDQETYGKDDLIRFIKDVVATEAKFGAKFQEVQEKLLKFFVERDVSEKTDHHFWLQRYTDMISDTNFVIPVLIDARIKSSENWPVFLYQTEYYNDKMLPENAVLKGPYHLAEFPYLFGISHFQNFEFDEKDKKVQKFWIDAISNFVKTGDPKWPILDVHDMNFMKISLEPLMESKLMQERLDFWTDLIENYDFDLVRGLFKK